MMRIAKITSATLATIILSGFIFLACSSGAVTESVNFNTPKLQSTEQKLNNLNVRYDSVNHQLLELHSTDQDKIQKLNSDKKELEQQRQDLQKQLQAKAEEKERIKLAAANAANTLTATETASAATPPAPPGGSHQDWMAAAGISPSDYGYVDYIVSHESGWNPNAVNSSGGACGLGQQLPCGKWAGAWNDPIAALVAMNGYVSKFGGWAGAYYYWQAHGNY